MSNDKNLIVNIQNGSIIFVAKNFIPKDELCLFMPNCYLFFQNQIINSKYRETFDGEIFDSKIIKLPYSIEQLSNLSIVSDSLSYKILENLPYARRGYIFNNKDLQSYYKELEWYIANPNYRAEIKDLSNEELKWLKKLSIKSSVKE